MAENNYLHDRLYPAIYNGYSSLLEGIYSTWELNTDTEKQACLQKLQDPVKELWNGYQGSNISPNYRRLDYQIAYMLRYFFPHSLIVPTILNSLWEKDELFEELVELLELTNLHIYADDCCYHHLTNRLLTASFFGCGPCPELYGLMHYLSNGPRITRISAVMFDSVPIIQAPKTQCACRLNGSQCAGSTIIEDPEISDTTANSLPEFPGWEYSKVIVFEKLLHQMQRPRLYKLTDFESNLAVEGNNFLHPASERWVTDSDLIISQFCLNEIPTPNHEQLKTNLMHIVNIMKPGALMLIIERYGYVEELLESLHHQLKTKFSNSLQMYRESHDQLNLRDINKCHVPEELLHNLFVQIPHNKTWLANKIEYHWLAIYKNYSI